VTSDRDSLPLRDERLLRLLDYWKGKRRADALPSRADIDPREFAWILGWVILVDVLAGSSRFRIRLHGTNLAERAGYDLTGQMLDQLPIADFRALAEQSFRTCAGSRQPFVSCRDRIIGDRRHRYETVMLPLAADGRVVDMLLVGLVYPDD